MTHNSTRDQFLKIKSVYFSQNTDDYKPLIENQFIYKSCFEPIEFVCLQKQNVYRCSEKIRLGNVQQGFVEAQPELHQQTFDHFVLF